MSDKSQTYASQGFALIGITLGFAWCVFLAGLGLLSNGRLDPQWPTALIFVLIAAMPAALGAIGFKAGRRSYLTAGIISIPISFMSLAGATLPLLIPAVFYFTASAKAPGPSRAP